MDPASLQTDQVTDQVERMSTHAYSQPQRGGRIPARGTAPGIRIAGNPRGLKDRSITVAWGTLRAQRGMRWSYRSHQQGDVFALTDAHLTALRNGKTLALDVQNEYVAFLTSPDRIGREDEHFLKTTRDAVMVIETNLTHLGYGKQGGELDNG